MSVLLSPINPIRKSIKWALVTHTVALFLFLTIAFVIGADHLFLEFVDNREFPGNDEYPPGPIGYDDILGFTAATTVLDAMFPLSQWLADGLLVDLIFNSVVYVFDVGRSSSCIVAMSFIP